MSIFDELPSTTDRLKTSITRELEFRRKRADPAEWNGYHYRGGADLVLREGRFWQGRVRPEKYDGLRGPMSSCFENALVAAQQTPGLQYVEGYCTSGFGVAILHGWCVDDEGVVELTLPASESELANSLSATSGMGFLPPDRWAYYGVTVAVEYVVASMGRFDRMGLLDWGKAEMPERHHHGLDTEPPPDYPLLRVSYDPNRRSLP